MYTSFFGLNEKPFAITPDPRYLFMSERHGEGLAHLLYGVTDSGGFIQLTGEVGTGKTTLVRTLLSQLPDQVDVALILNPQVTVLEFLRSICYELGVNLPQNAASPMALVTALNAFLLDAHSRGRRIILLVDEAQNLSTEVLEQLRLLTNLETARQKLLQIILIGQPELRELLAQNNLRQLAQRVTGRYHLEPLSREETDVYIAHRLKVAGAVGEIFEPAARREVHRLSGGIPRLINVICDRALLGAYSRERRSVDRALVRLAASEVSGGPITKPRTGLKRASIAAAIVLAIAAGYGVAALNAGPASPPAAEPVASDAVAALPVELETPPPTRTTSPAIEGGVSGTIARQRPADADRVSLDTLLDSRPQSDAVAELLTLWDIAYTDADGYACQQVERAGMRCLWQTGSWGILERLDRPAVLTLTDRTGRNHEVLLVSLDGNRAGIRVGGETMHYPVAEVSSLWYGRYLMLWQPAGGTPRPLAPGSRGPGVAWLRESLAELGRYEPDPAAAAADLYDPALEEAVRRFQQDNRLRVDGLAGAQTQIVISSALGDARAPSLSSDS